VVEAERLKPYRGTKATVTGSMRMVNDYSRFSTLNAVRIVEACFKAGKLERIVPALLDHRSGEGVAAELAAEAALVPEHTAGRTTPAPTGGVSRDAFAEAIERRFRAQGNRRPGSS
jgi:hypothetical protein